MAEVIQKFKDEAQCAVCLDTYTDPKMLQCDHIYCQKCLTILMRRGIITCPECRATTPVPNGVENLKPAFRMNKHLDILNELEKIQQKTVYCDRHPQEELNLYCETCRKQICVQCIANHSLHRCKPLGEVVETYRKAAVAPTEKRLAAASQALENMTVRYREIFDQQTTVEDELYRESGQLHRAIEERKDKLISSLYHITQEKLRDLSHQKNQVETTKTQLSTYLEKVKILSGNPNEVVRELTKGSEVKTLTSLLNTTIVEEPNTKADVKYSNDCEAIKVCQNYGQLVQLGSLDPAKCCATGTGLRVATVSKRSTILVRSIDYNGRPYKKPVESLRCVLESGITHKRVCGVVERQGESQYKISYQPTIKGRHQLHITVEGQDIMHSPFDIMAKLPLEKLDEPFLTIPDVIRPWGVALNKRGEVVVTENAGSCVSVFTPSGEELRSFSKCGNDRLKNPRGIAVDDDGNILVSDCMNHRIQKFTADGKFVTSVNTLGPLKLEYPKGIAVNTKIYVCNSEDNQVHIVNSASAFSRAWYRCSKLMGQFHNPRGVACDKIGNVYVADGGNHRIQVFTAEGKFLRMFGRHGKCKGELDTPIGVVVDNSGNIFVSEYNNHRVSVFDSHGRFVTLFGGVEEMKFPIGLAVDDTGVVYVCDSGYNRILVY